MRRRPTAPLLLLTALALCLRPGGVAAAQAPPGAPWSGGRPAAPPPRVQDLVRVRLATDATALVPGATAHLAVIFEIAPHWHLYWENAGASGGPPRLTVTAPDGYVVGAPRFPRPVSFEEPVGRTYGYLREAVLFVPVTAPADARTGTTIEIGVQASYLVCRDVCLLGRAERTIEVPVLASAPAPANHAAGADRAAVERHLRRLPHPLAALDGARATHEGDVLVVTGPAAGHASVEFFPIDAPGVMFGEPETEVRDGRFRVVAPVEIRPQNALGRTIVLRGVVGLGTDQDAPSYAVAVEPAAP